VGARAGGAGELCAHYATGEPLPQLLLERCWRHRTRPGVPDTEYIEAAAIDQSWHQIEAREARRRIR